MNGGNRKMQEVEPSNKHERKKMHVAKLTKKLNEKNVQRINSENNNHVRDNTLTRLRTKNTMPPFSKLRVTLQPI